MERTIEVRSNPNVNLSTVEATVRQVMNNHPTSRYSGWIGYGEDAYLIFWCTNKDYADMVRELTYRAFILI